MIQDDLLAAAALRFISMLSSLEALEIAILAVPVILTAATRSVGLALLGALATLAAAFTLGLGTPEAVVYGVGLWLASWLLAVKGLGDFLSRRRLRSHRDQLRRIEGQINVLSSQCDRLFMQQLRTAIAPEPDAAPTRPLARAGASGERRALGKASGDPPPLEVVSETRPAVTTRDAASG